MVFSFKIALPDDLFISFMDSFGDEKTKDPIREVRAWIYQILTKKGLEWTQTQKNGQFTLRKIDKNGKTDFKNMKLTDFDLKEWIPESDPNYIPDSLDADRVSTFEMKLGTTLTEKLQNVIALNRLISIRFNESLLSYERNRDNKTIEDPDAHKKELKQETKRHEEFQNYPIEHFLRNFVINDIAKKVEDHEKEILDDEFEKLYPDDDKKEKIKKKKLQPVKQEVAGTRTPRKKMKR